ncbi:MAG: hypothetical protein IAE82_15410 [Opitutaceae bacterium]|nr:hypothetical protein [Opitutaceae bacterium]
MSGSANSPRAAFRGLRGLARLLGAGLAGLLLVVQAWALDEVVLTNGRKYLGTIVASTPDSILLSIDGGTVEFPRTAVVSPPHFGPPSQGADSTEGSQVAFDPRKHPLPPLNLALRRLREFSWSTSPRQVPVLVIDRGRWRFVPAVSFWVGGFCQVSCYGDPARPAAIEVSLHRPAPDAWEQKRDLLEYMMGLVPGLAADSRFDGLNIHGDSFAIGDLWFSVASSEATGNPDRWTVRLIHETSLAAARATLAELQSISEPLAETVIDPTKPRSWQRGSWTVDDLAWLRAAPALAAETDGTAGPEPAPVAAPEKSGWSVLGGERVFVRSFSRERGGYARSTNDWLREFAANTAGP